MNATTEPLTHGPAIRARHAAGEDVSWLTDPASYSRHTVRPFRCRVTGEGHDGYVVLDVRLPDGTWGGVAAGTATEVERIYQDRITALEAVAHA